MDRLKRRHVPSYTAIEEGGDEFVNVEGFDGLIGEKYSKPRRPSGNKYLDYLQENREWVIPAFLTLLSFWTRWRLIGKSNIVVWDEAHFGKFGSHYLKREFYFDVHPPLAKMLVALSGLLSGYDGSFGFESGATYPSNVNYTFMRMFGATFGALLVPLAFYTAKALRYSERASILAATMVLLELSLLTISRFILLDSMLLFFTAASLFCLARFHNYQSESFSPDWWLWLYLTGVSIGCVASVKWVGLFAVALVGLYTVSDLWDKFGDTTMKPSIYIRHWIARIVCLIIVPICIYIGCFAIHFAILNRSGPGDAQMSSLFQAGLVGNDYDRNPLELAYGSKFTLKNSGYGGGLLHSHVQTFPSGSKQQQVTCYHYKDNNNEWILRKPRNAANEVVPESEEVEYVRNGDIVRLMHGPTGRNLHSHPIKAPVTTSQWEVSCYGNETIGDSNDHWKVEIVDDMYDKSKTHVRSLTTRIRLRHVNLGCLLTANNVVLPQWGFKQIEVYCDKRNRLDDPHAMWNVEQHWNDKLPPAPPKSYRSNFFKDLLHLNVAMLTSNNALTPDPDKEDILTSTPDQWPFMQVGLRMCGWGDETVKYYLLGNPVVWWGSTLSLFVFLGLLLYYVLRRERKIYDLSPEQWGQFTQVGQTILLGWLLHYFPFWLMGRVTYVHHYLPALYFSIFLAPYLLDQFTPQRSRPLVFGAVFALVILVFIYFSDIAFGMDYPASRMTSRRWLKSWNLVD
ncbi:uncharacterized protein VTP21DRAFT_11636 [Calcarisporiella thermophila]|uniref:uncharacterized protein n=1 Tax=Calcarisporiella thermophila TaxID=911321 RepID=UPI0037434812